ncbi:unnamed protein product [Peronospora belbahrii]|uniref:Uncharacterized protein n=1 Tax=Peronospora belbahrii TaxID=622444 RepID=A0AAU9L4B8_9STRA|nr:unnamed protein product [Peronospora belbahrii]
MMTGWMQRCGLCRRSIKDIVEMLDAGRTFKEAEVKEVAERFECVLLNHWKDNCLNPKQSFDTLELDRVITKGGLYDLKENFLDTPYLKVWLKYLKLAFSKYTDQAIADGVAYLDKATLLGIISTLRANRGFDKDLFLGVQVAVMRKSLLEDEVMVSTMVYLAGDMGESSVAFLLTAPHIGHGAFLGQDNISAKGVFDLVDIPELLRIDDKSFDFRLFKKKESDLDEILLSSTRFKLWDRHVTKMNSKDKNEKMIEIMVDVITDVRVARILELATTTPATLKLAESLQAAQMKTWE